jgi:hypothetical protein
MVPSENKVLHEHSQKGNGQEKTMKNPSSMYGESIEVELLLNKSSHAEAEIVPSFKVDNSYTNRDIRSFVEDEEYEEVIKDPDKLLLNLYDAIGTLCVPNMDNKRLHAYKEIMLCDATELQHDLDRTSQLETGTICARLKCPAEKEATAAYGMDPRFKRSMPGTPLQGHRWIYGYNEGVVIKHPTLDRRSLKERRNALTYHWLCKQINLLSLEDNVQVHPPPQLRGVTDCKRPQGRPLHLESTSSKHCFDQLVVEHGVCETRQSGTGYGSSTT